MDAVIVSIFPIVALLALAIIMCVYDYKEYRLSKKCDLLNKMIENNYETDNVDIDKL